GFAGSLPLLAAGLLSWPRSGRSWTRSELLDTLLLLGVAFLFGFAFVLAPVVEAGLDGFSAWLLLAYPLGDILILGVILTGVALKSLRDHGRLIVLGLGLLALVAADTLFALAGDAYATGHPLDVGWALGFAALGACTLLPPGWGTRLRVPARIGPFLVIALFALVGAYDLVQWSGPLPALELADAAIAFALLLLLALRYASLAGARLRESRRLEAISFELESAYAVRQGALDASRTGVCVIGPHQAVAFQNSAWRRLLGSAADDPEGWADLLAGEVPSLRYWTGGKFLVVSRVSLAGGDTVITVDDLTDQERERSTRDRFLAEVVGAREREARRIAELLHDDVVQRLTALAMRLELAGLRASDPSLGELSGEAGGIVGSIRQLLVELHPAVLESQGLSAAADAAAHTLRSLGV
ncbi:MAG: histidine kinase, partial [Gaiellaceae bacterium]